MAEISDQAVHEYTQALQEYAPDVIINAAVLKEAMLTVRCRLRSQPDNQGRGEDVITMAYCLQPLWNWQTVQVSALGLDSDDIANLTWNLFCATVSRTKLAEKFAAVTEDSGAWEEVIVLLEDLPLNWPWLSMRSLIGLQELGLLLVAGIAGLCETRWSRSCALFAFALQAVLLALWIQFGSDIGGRIKLAKTPLARGDDSDKPSISSASLQLIDSSTPQMFDAAPAVELQTAVASPGSQELQATPVHQAGTGEQVQSQAVFGPCVTQQDCPSRPSIGNPLADSAGNRRCRICSYCGEIGEIGRATMLCGLCGKLVHELCFLDHYHNQHMQDDCSPSGGHCLPYQCENRDLCGHCGSKIQAVFGVCERCARSFCSLACRDAHYWELHREVYVGLQHFEEAAQVPPSPSHGQLSQDCHVPLEVSSSLENAQAVAFADASPVQRACFEQMQCHLRLNEGLQRAAPEIYWSIRSEGATSVRDFISSEHSLEQRSTPGYQERFASATIIDFELKDCTSTEALSHSLATSDTLEVELRKLGAWIYERRTGDKAGALRILAVRAPGPQTDVIPKWLLEETTLHAKNEFQCAERASKMRDLGKVNRGSGGDRGGVRLQDGQPKKKAKAGKSAPHGGGGTQG